MKDTPVHISVGFTSRKPLALPPPMRRARATHRPCGQIATSTTIRIDACSQGTARSRAADARKAKRRTPVRGDSFAAGIDDSRPSACLL